jgi:hypothetical protein
VASHDGEGYYDVRLGAAAYAPIVGAFGALAVPAIVVVFTAAKSHHSADFTFAAGLLVLGMIGSVLGAFGLAAIGAESDPTANLGPAVMLIGIPVVISIVSILGAFEVLSVVYLSRSAALFVAIVGAVALFGVVLSAFAIVDSTGLETINSEKRDEWLNKQWLKTREQAYSFMNRALLVGSIPPVVGVIARIAVRPDLVHAVGVNTIVGFGLLLTVGASVWGVLRTSHRKEERAITCREACASLGFIGIYSLVLLISLP